jgi:hypothetical protein
MPCQIHGRRDKVAFVTLTRKTMPPSLKQSLSAWSAAPYPAGRFEGRGIVICAGGPRYFTCAWVLITLLRRHYRSDLPIQVWHLGKREMSEEMHLLLAEMNVEVIDAEKVVADHPARIAGGWPLKPYAILNSRFREVLYLDADTVPLVDDLRPLFEWDVYRARGLLLWPDMHDLSATAPIWNDVGLAPRTSVSIEASILLADKRQVWDELRLSVLLNEHVEEIYSSIYGDKDTFLLAALLRGRTPDIIPHRPFRFDIDLVQRDLDGEPLLVHRTGSKWRLSGPHRPLPSPELTQVCEQIVADLGNRWSGAVFNPPERSPQAQAEWQRLVGTRFFHYEAPSSRGRRLELLPTGRVGEGRAGLEQHWAVVERDGGIALQFYSVARRTFEFARNEDGSWRGVNTEGLGARLVAENAHATWPHAAGAAASAAGWISLLLDDHAFAAGFDAEKAARLRAALHLVNERFDDLPEQVEARLTAVADRAWRQMLAETAAALAAARDKRLALTAPTDYPRTFNRTYYDPVP